MDLSAWCNRKGAISKVSEVQGDDVICAIKNSATLSGHASHCTANNPYRLTHTFSRGQGCYEKMGCSK